MAVTASLNPGGQIADGGRPLTGLPRKLVGLHGVLLDLRHCSVGLLRGRCLRLRAAADLIDGDEDFSGGTRQLLNRGGQLLGSRADLLSAACHGPASLQIFGQSRKRLRGLLALVERLTLLLYRPLRLCHGRRLLLGGAGDQFGAAGSLARGYVGLDGSGEDRFADLRKCGQLAARRAQIDGDRAGGRRLFAGALGDRPDAQRQRPDFFGDACRQLLDVPGAALGDLGERTDFIGHNGETLAVVARSCRLDGGVQCQQVRAVGNVGHHQRGRADTFRLLLQLRDDLDRGKLAARTGLSMATTESSSWAAVSRMALCRLSVFRLDRSASVRAWAKAAPSELIAAIDSCAAPAASSAPAEICSSDRLSCSAAAAASDMPLASCSVAAPIRSAAFCWRTRVRSCARRTTVALPAVALSSRCCGRLAPRFARSVVLTSAISFPTRTQAETASLG